VVPAVYASPIDGVVWPSEGRIVSVGHRWAHQNDLGRVLE